MSYFYRLGSRKTWQSSRGEYDLTMLAKVQLESRLLLCINSNHLWLMQREPHDPAWRYLYRIDLAGQAW